LFLMLLNFSLICPKKLATSSCFQDRMMFAAHSFSALKNSPVLQKVSSTKDLVPFSVTHSSYAESSPTTRVDTMGLQTAPMSPTLGRKVYKTAKKSRSVTQLILMDAGSHAVAKSSADFEATGSAIPPQDL